MWESQRIFRFSSLAKNTIFDMDYFSCFLAQGNVHNWRPTIFDDFRPPHPLPTMSNNFLTYNIRFFGSHFGPPYLP